MPAIHIDVLEMEAGVHWTALRHFNNSLMLAEGVDLKTRMDRLGHVSDPANIFYSQVNDQAQLQASELIMQKLEAAGSQLKRQQPTAA
jgi:hypothetical protein